MKLSSLHRICRLIVLLSVTVLALTGCYLAPVVQEVRDLVAGSETATVVPTKAVDERAPTATPLPPDPLSPGTNVTSQPDGSYSLADLYERVNPAVVNIAVWARVSVSDSSIFPFGTPNAESYLQQGEGSGFCYDSLGHIVTNYHVVRGAERITVTFYDDTVVPAQLVGGDPDSDLAVIKVDVEREQLMPLPLGDSDQTRVGQEVVAIGNPFGLAGTMTRGIISAVGRTMPAGGGDTSSYSIPDVIQTDAAINPGNSGGPLLNLYGEVIGVNTAIESAVQSNAGIGFCVPSNIVKKVVPRLIENGRYDHPRLGISGWTITSAWAEAAGLNSKQRGVLVVEVTADSQAAVAGLRGSTTTVIVDGQSYPAGGDIILGIDGETVNKFEDLISYLTRYTKVGQKVTLEVLRNGRTIKIELTLDARPRSTS